MQVPKLPFQASNLQRFPDQQQNQAELRGVRYLPEMTESSQFP